MSSQYITSVTYSTACSRGRFQILLDNIFFYILAIRGYTYWAGLGHIGSVVYPSLHPSPSPSHLSKCSPSSPIPRSAVASTVGPPCQSVTCPLTGLLPSHGRHPVGESSRSGLILLNRRYGPLVRLPAGKQTDPGSSLFRFSFLFNTCGYGYCLVTVSLTIKEAVQWLTTTTVAHTVAHRNAEA